MDDGKIQEGARGLAMFCAHGDPEQQKLLLANVDTSALAKALDSKKRLCTTKQTAMEAMGQLSLTSEATWADLLTKGAVSLLAKQLKCEQGRCQLGALIALHRLMVIAPYSSTPGVLGGTPGSPHAPAPAPAPEPAKKKGGLLKMASGLKDLKDKSKLARSMGRLVGGTSTGDLPQQLCDAGAMETMMSMVSGDRSLRDMAADILLAVAKHENRIHHLSKRGAVEVACALMAAQTDKQLQLKGLTLMSLLAEPRAMVVAEKGLRDGNVDRAFAADAVRLLGALLQDAIPELSCKAADVMVLLGDTSPHRALVATHGGVVERLLSMCFESPAHKASALHALEQLARDETGTAQRWIVEAGSIPRLLELVVAEDRDLTVTLSLLCLLANTDAHRQAMIEHGAIAKVLAAVSPARDPAFTCTHAARLLEHLSPYKSEAGVAHVVEEGGLKPLVALLDVGMSNCRAAAAGALGELASQSADNRQAMVELGVVQTLVSGLQDASWQVKAPYARALGGLAQSDEYKAAIGQAGAVSDLVAMLGSGAPEPAYTAAASALEVLARHEPNRQQLVAANGLPPLVALLDKTPAAARGATLALQEVASSAEFTGKVAETPGALPAMLNLAEAPATGCATEAHNILRMVADQPQLRDALVATKGMAAALVRTLEAEAQSTEAKTDALAALAAIGADPKHRCALVVDRAIEPASALLTQETWQDKESAAWLLCRLAQATEAAHHAVFNAPGVLLQLKSMLADEGAALGGRTAAAAALGALASHGSRYQEAVAGDGTMWLLSSLLGEPSEQAAARTAAKALSNITSGNPDMQAQASEADVLEKAVALLSPNSELSTRCAAARTVSNLLFDAESRKAATEAGALQQLMGMLLDHEPSSKAAAGVALAALLKDNPDTQAEFAASPGIGECLSLLHQGAADVTTEQTDPAAVLSAAKTVFTMVGSPALYGAVDPVTVTGDLTALLAHRDAAVADAAGQLAGTMAQANPAVRAKLAGQTPAMIKLLTDKREAPRDAALAVLRALATVNANACEQVAKNKAACKVVQKLTEKSGTQAQDDAIKLWKVLAEAGAQ